MDAARERIAALLDAVFEGSCSDSERAEFVELVNENPQLVEMVVNELGVHSLLQWQSEDITRDLAGLEEFSGVGVASRIGELAAGRTRRSIWYMVWAIAGMVIVACGLIVRQSFHSKSDAVAHVATIIGQNGVQWADHSSALARDDLVVPGQLVSTSGSFSLHFRNGPTMQVDGPAALRIESDMLVLLESGQVTARVPPPLKGFTIKTPTVGVVDQGTEFGVAYRGDGNTDVIVFDGEVDVHESASALGEPHRLVRGEAARIGRTGAMDRITQVRRDLKGGWWTLDRPHQIESVIKEVSDNVPPSDGSKYYCYQISFQSLRDDAPAYVDQPAQWNGLTAKGLPKFLIGADYVQTFNDYRYFFDNFEIVVKLSCPANLFVFADNRVPPPDWLTAQFDDTGIDIGSDEGPWMNIPDEYKRFDRGHSMDVGGGNSIDVVFSVWRRKCLDTRPVTLGHVGDHGTEGDQGRAMYGIAATPLDRE